MPGQQRISDYRSILSTGKQTGLKRLVLHGMQAVGVVALLAALLSPQSYQIATISVAFVLSAAVLLYSIFYGRVAVKEFGRQQQLMLEADDNRQQISELFAMTDMLQAAEDYEDAGAILMATSQRLLPTYGGALYVFNNSRDRLDLAQSWNRNEGFQPSSSLLPGNCWALKRGKPHINDPATQTLCCMHQIGVAATVEVPMLARGQVHGLLVLATDAEGAFDRLMSVRRLARALADSMSLALSNIALRDQLRTQSLRDPLTGLYNRRYMEDALERYISLAERSESATSVIMIDLDNFKRLNDEFGHAKGDAVLRDAAAQLLSSVRPSDVVCRFGGEELLVILPNCDLMDASIKAETMRTRIESLSEPHGVTISASFGVASVPDTSTGPSDIIPMADAALYVAKHDGKNCVRVADRRIGKDKSEAQPRLAVG